MLFLRLSLEEIWITLLLTCLYFLYYLYLRYRELGINTVCAVQAYGIFKVREFHDSTRKNTQG